MTFKEHLEVVGEVLESRGATPVQVLYFQLYFICLARDGYLIPNYATEGFRESRHDEPYKTLLEKTPWDNLWLKAIGEKENDSYAIDLLFDFFDKYSKEPEIDNYYRLFDSLINKVARYDCYAFDHYQPLELTALVYHISDYKEGMTVYNPYAGVGSYADIFNAGNKYYGEEIDSVTWGIGVLRSYLLQGDYSKNYVIGDSLRRSRNTLFDIVVSTPPACAVDSHMDDFSTCLVKDAKNNLKENGCMIMVTDSSFISSENRELFANSGILDAVISLPKHVYCSVPDAPVVLRFKMGRDPLMPIKIFDGTSFGVSGGLNRKIITIDELLSELDNQDSAYYSFVSLQDLFDEGLNNILNRNKAKETHRLVPLSDLGEIVKPATSKDELIKIIRSDQLSENPLHMDVFPVEIDENDDRPYGIITSNALLISRGNPNHPKFGLYEYDSDCPVGIASTIFAFVPNEDIVSAQYIAVVLAKEGIYPYGSTIQRINIIDLLRTRIPLVPFEEQNLVVRSYRQDHKDFVLHQKVRIAKLGNPIIPKSIYKQLSKQESFNEIRELKDWLSDSENRKRIDAVVINQTSAIDYLDLFNLCSSYDKLPVFILSKSVSVLKEKFGNYSDQYLKERSFEIGHESDLFVSLFNYVASQNSPEGKIRQEYARQLEAAANLDAKFCYKGFWLYDKLEELLLNIETGKEMRNAIRNIRDNCLLEPLVQYGFLPQVNNKTLKKGALVDLMADRYYNDKSGEKWIVKKPLFPKHLVLLLRSTKDFLNEGSHVLSSSDKDIQVIALQVVMALICRISDLIMEGVFDKLEPDTKSGVYYCDYSKECYQVKLAKDTDDYFYADAIHLDTQTCLNKNINPGDYVQIEVAKEEMQPRYIDKEEVFFYSKQFRKVN